MTTGDITESPVGAALIARLNENFRDSVLLIGRALGGHPAATECEVVALDGAGVIVTLTDPAGVNRVRIEFDETVSDELALTPALFRLLDRAREVTGDSEPTAAERSVQALAATRIFLTRVVSVHDVHAHLRCITFTGGDLDEFTVPGPDAALYLILPPAAYPDRRDDHLPLDRLLRRGGGGPAPGVTPTACGRGGHRSESSTCR
jgi:hypothetical protein